MLWVELERMIYKLSQVVALPHFISAFSTFSNSIPFKGVEGDSMREHARCLR